MKRIGLIVNPIAGLGGRVGLKGSDGADIQQRALQLGAIPRAQERTIEALKVMLPMQADLEILTYPGNMGEYAASRSGFSPHVLDKLDTDQTSAEDTKRAVGDMLQEAPSLLLFTGGDGTACDIVSAGGMEIPALGIPAGVKIHSAAYAIHPRAAGQLATAYLQSKAKLDLAEVMDLDEEAFRQGRVSPKLYGYLRVPYIKRYIQGVKSPSVLSSKECLQGIAQDIAERMLPDTVYILGPGSSTHTIAKFLGFDKTLLGVDAYLNGKIISKDANETALVNLLTRHQLVEIIVTPIGGQGSIFGRGNQPISPEIIHRVGKKHVTIVSTPDKINALNGRPLWVDTGDEDLDKMLCGHYQVITGYKERAIYKVTT